MFKAMRIIINKLYLFAAICLISGSIAFPAAAQNSTAQTDLDHAQKMIEELSDRVGDLEKEINDMHLSQGDDWLTVQLRLGL